jgi:hypothetical protein
MGSGAGGFRRSQREHFGCLRFRLLVFIALSVVSSPCGTERAVTTTDVSDIASLPPIRVSQRGTTIVYVFGDKVVFDYGSTRYK